MNNNKKHTKKEGFIAKILLFKLFMGLFSIAGMLLVFGLLWFFFFGPARTVGRSTMNAVTSGLSDVVHEAHEANPHVQQMNEDWDSYCDNWDAYVAAVQEKQRAVDPNFVAPPIE